MELRRLGAVTAALAVVLVGCGTDRDAGDTPSEATPEAPTVGLPAFTPVPPPSATGTGPITDNALLAGFSAESKMIHRNIVEEVADVFDMLPRTDAGALRGDSREATAAVMNAAGREELWEGNSISSINSEATSTESPLAEELSTVLAAQARRREHTERETEAGQLTAAYNNWNPAEVSNG